jgi:hypothetical protein
LRDQLTAELNDLKSAEDAANWAQRVLPTKNTLTIADAERVAQAFQARLASIVIEASDGRPVAQEARSSALRAVRRKRQRRVTVIDKGVLALSTPRRIRDRDHVRLVAKQPCLVCGARPMLTICDSRNQKRLAAKSAMSSLCPCVVAIIATFTAVAMKRHGGKRPALIRPFPLVPCGWKAIHYRQRAATPKAESNGVRLTKRSQFLKSVPNDLRQTDRGQPSQLSQEHGS